MSDVIRPSVWKFFSGLAFAIALVVGLVVLVGGGIGGDDKEDQPVAAESQVATPAEDPDIQTIDNEAAKANDGDFDESGLSDSEVGLNQ